MDGAHERSFWRSIRPVDDVEVLSWQELARRAGSRMKARRLVAGGLYRRVVRGFYVDAALADSPELRCTVLTRALPGGVALSGRTALWAMGVDVLPRSGLMHVAAERGKHLEPRPGLRPWSALLPDHELVELPSGLLSVSAPRAFVDVARRETLVEAVALGDAVLRSGAAVQEQLTAAVDRARGLRGVIAARAVLPHLEPRSESQGESRLRMRLVLGGLPRPEAQVDYYDVYGAHVGRVDLVIKGVLLEYDGREQRLKQEVFGHDRRRQNRFVDVDAHIRRYTSDDVKAGMAAVLCAGVMRAVAEHPEQCPDLRRGPDTLRKPRLKPLPTRADQARKAA